MQYPELRRGRVGSDCPQENRTALNAVRHEPTPEVATLERSTDCSPSTADKREVQKNDPSIFCDKLFLHSYPLIARRCDKTLPPENLVKLDYRKSRDLAQSPREG
jgi:hypothetical protein